MLTLYLYLLSSTLRTTQGMIELEYSIITHLLYTILHIKKYRNSNTNSTPPILKQWNKTAKNSYIIFVLKIMKTQTLCSSWCITAPILFQKDQTWVSSSLWIQRPVNFCQFTGDMLCSLLFHSKNDCALPTLPDHLAIAY